MQLHPWVKCREYLTDALVWTHFPKIYNREGIYGFPFIEGVNTKEVELLFKCEKNFLPCRIRVMHEMEDELDISRTQVEVIDETTSYIKADPWWNRTTLHLSAYTMLLRALSWKGPDNWAGLEKNIQESFSYLRGKMKGILLALKESNYSTIVQTERTDAYTIHGAAGVATFYYAVTNRITDAYKYGSLVSVYNARNDSETRA